MAFGPVLGKYHILDLWISSRVNELVSGTLSEFFREAAGDMIISLYCAMLILRLNESLALVLGERAACVPSPGRDPEFPWPRPLPLAHVSRQMRLPGKHVLVTRAVVR